MKSSERAIIFWGACIPLRLGLAFLAKDNKHSVRLRAFAAAISLRWLTNGVTNTRGFFGGPVWWANERRLHGAVWALYAAINQWQWLFLDAGLGAGNYVAKKI